MQLNTVTLNVALTTSYLTGDVNGPTEVWAPTTVPGDATWQGVFA